MTENTPRWVAGLSNGETLIEGKGICKQTGDPTPWTLLQNYLQEKNLRINSFQIRAGDKQFNLPSIKPRFEGESPIKYNCWRVWKGDVLGTGFRKEGYIKAEAIYNNFILQLYVDTNDTNKSWTNILMT